jgi:tetratricopeptide (TPR) repeat protein
MLGLQSSSTTVESQIKRESSEPIDQHINLKKYHAALILIRNQKVRAAEKLLREVLLQEPYFTMAAYALSECARLTAKKDEQKKILEAILKIDDREIYRYALAKVYYELGQDDRSLKNYLQALSLLPDNTLEYFEALKNVGNIYVRGHDFEAAEEYYNRAFRINPDSSSLLVNLGTLSIQKNQFNDAILFFREAIYKDLKCDQAWVGLALVHHELSDIELSWANLKSALDINALNTTAIQLALSWVTKDNKWEQTIEFASQYLEKNGEDALISLALAQLWYLRGKLDFARMEVERASAIDPGVFGLDELKNLITQEEKKRSHEWDRFADPFAEVNQ